MDYFERSGGSFFFSGLGVASGVIEMVKSQLGNRSIHNNLSRITESFWCAFFPSKGHRLVADAELTGSMVIL